MRYYLVLLFAFLVSCSNDSEEEIVNPPGPENPSAFINGADLSSLPMLDSKNIEFFDENNEKVEMLPYLKSNGLNTVRIRIWNHPEDVHSSFEEVKSFSKKVKSLGLKVWITVHYSDTWADPGHQTPPEKWQNIPYEDLKDSVYNYTGKIINEIDPDIIQIGNEINSGFLFPYGKISDNESQFLELLSEGIKAVKDHSNQTKTMIHFAGLNGADWFFDKVKSLDYDFIGLSYYPTWHGKNLSTLQSTLTSISAKYDKEVVIAETAYPFTLQWNDWTNNIVGLENQLILPEYPATENGQEGFISTVKKIVEETPKGIGLCYWGGELVAFNGPEAKDGSPWENQALFDFENMALSVIKSFNEE